jgi:hypothetical protein
VIRLKYEIACACEGRSDLDLQISGEAHSVPRIEVTPTNTQARRSSVVKEIRAGIGLAGFSVKRALA